MRQSDKISLGLSTGVDFLELNTLISQGGILQGHYDFQTRFVTGGNIFRSLTIIRQAFGHTSLRKGLYAWKFVLLFQLN